MANIKVIHFKVVGRNTMHCSGCEHVVETLLSRLPGVQKVEASRKTQEIRVTVDEQQSGRKKIANDLETFGYEVVEKSHQPGRSS